MCLIITLILGLTGLNRAIARYFLSSNNTVHSFDHHAYHKLKLEHPEVPYRIINNKDYDLVNPATSSLSRLRNRNLIKPVITDAFEKARDRVMNGVMVYLKNNK